MNYKRICVWTGPLGQTEGLMRTLTSLPGTEGLRDPLSQEFIRLTGANAAAPSPISIGQHQAETLVMRSPAAHAIGIDLRNFSEDLHIFFLQHPDERLPSLTHAVEDPEWQVRAYTWQQKLYQRLSGLGATCIALDAQQWRNSPIKVLKKLAAILGVASSEFNPILPQPEHVWRGEAMVNLGLEENLRETCLKSYHWLYLQAIQDFEKNESEPTLAMLA